MSDLLEVFVTGALDFCGAIWPRRTAVLLAWILGLALLFALGLYCILG